MKKVTIETVAQKVGVSAATVSYALSGKRKISQEVTDRILQAVEELDYRPSITARNLASNKTWTVGLYASPTQNIREDYFFNNIQAFINFPEASMLPVKMFGIVAAMADKKLRSSCISASMCHR